MRRLSATPFFLCFSLFVGACSSASDAGPAESGETAISGGTPANGPEFDAIGKVRIGGHDRCAGTLVAPQIVMTASHCRMGVPAPYHGDVAFVLKDVAYPVKAELTTGADGIGYIGAGRDAALYLLASPVPASAGIKAIPVRARALDASDEGRVFTVVGWGAGEDRREKGPLTLDAVSGNPYKKAFPTEQAYVDYVVRATGLAPTTPYEAMTLVDAAYEVHGGVAPKDARTCFGDSGGPLLDRVGNHYEVVAITTGGDAKCALGTVFTAMGPEVQDVLARAGSKADPWSAFCAKGFETDGVGTERSRCNGSEVVQCFGGGAANAYGQPISAIHVDACTSYGAANACETRGPSFARCSHAASGAPVPALASDPDAIVTLLPSSTNGCLLRKSGRVECWGRVLGDLQSDFVAPAPYAGLSDVVSLTRGYAGFYALRKNGAVVYWGASRSGQIGDYDSPSTVLTIPGAVELSGVCARTTSGQVTCFEDGPGGGAPKTIAGVAGAVQVAGGVSLELVIPPSGQVDAQHGRAFGCARDASGKVVCWGANVYGQLGAGLPSSINLSEKPVAVEGLVDAVDLAASANQACAVRANGRVVCWGQLPRGIVTSTGALFDHVWSPRPVELAGVTDAVRVSVAFAAPASVQICALRKKGVVTCWGDGQYQVRAPHAANESRWTYDQTPRAGIDIREIVGAASVAPSGRGACVVMPSGKDVRCWGSGQESETKVGTFGLPGFGGNNYSIPQKADL